MGVSKDNVNAQFELCIGEKACRIFISIFLILIIIPPLYRNVFEVSAKLKAGEKGHNLSHAPIIEIFKKEKEQSLGDHFKNFEEKIEDAIYAEAPRKIIQSALSLGPLKEGNPSVRIGKDGWLFLDDAIESLTGQGPFQSHRFSNDKIINSSVDAIKNFASQLNDFGVHLILVSIPSKAMIYPEKINRNLRGPIFHHDTKRIIKALNSSPNLDVLDITKPLFNLKSQNQVFLKQDTHWTPEAMELAAKIIADHIKSLGITINNSNLNARNKEERKAYGDLAEKINIWNGGFSEEVVLANQIQGNTRNRNSEVILLGDSFTNIYSSNQGLDWGVNAGLPEHIALNIGTPIDVISINGGGATEVRKKLAQRRGSSKDMKNKKVIVWALTSRDLYLSKQQGIDRNISWEDVTFDQRQPDSKTSNNKISVRAKLITKPKLPNPNQTTYKDLLYGADYEIIETLSGKFQGNSKVVAIVNWAFKNRKLLPSADYEIGSVRNLQIVPFEEMKDLQTLEQLYEGDNFDLYWELAKNPKKTEIIEQITLENDTLRHQTSIIICSIFTVFIFIGCFRIPKHNQR